MENEITADRLQGQKPAAYKKTWVNPSLMVISSDYVRTGTTPGTKEFDDGLGHLYSS